jgi:hypothetical protein
VDLHGEVRREFEVTVLGSPVCKLLMGSTEQRILLDADRPVLSVKP